MDLVVEDFFHRDDVDVDVDDDDRGVTEPCCRSASLSVVMTFTVAIVDVDDFPISNTEAIDNTKTLSPVTTSSWFASSSCKNSIGEYFKDDNADDDDLYLFIMEDGVG
jgi:hypothetical protein